MLCSCFTAELSALLVDDLFEHGPGTAFRPLSGLGICADVSRREYQRGIDRAFGASFVTENRGLVVDSCFDCDCIIGVASN